MNQVLKQSLGCSGGSDIMDIETYETAIPSIIIFLVMALMFAAGYLVGYPSHETVGADKILNYAGKTYKLVEISYEIKEIKND